MELHYARRLVALYKKLIVIVTSFYVQNLSEYNIIFPFIEKTGRKPCCIREQMIGIAMVSKHDFDNVTFDWSCNINAL